MLFLVCLSSSQVPGTHKQRKLYATAMGKLQGHHHLRRGHKSGWQESSSATPWLPLISVAKLTPTLKVSEGARVEHGFCQRSRWIRK